MKKTVKVILIVLCVSSLLGCQYKDKWPQSGSGQAEITGTVDKKEIPKEETQGEKKVAGEESQDPVTFEPVTGDNLTVATEFAKDLLNENFPKLIQAYQYDENMKKAITDDETKKTVLFNNSEYGNMEKINEAYAITIGGYQHIIVPVKCTIGNFNYQIAFDGSHNIVGFSYEEYASKEPMEDNTIPDGVKETEYSFSSGGFVIPGTFTAPEAGDRFPVVILVQGSGASNRDESIYENKPFRDIAWALAKQGIASYRYDKRSYLYAEQMAEDKSVTIKDEITDDVVAAALMVKKLEGADSSRIYILGHSLSGYMIPEIAQKIPDAAGYILMAAPAEHIKEYIMDEYNYLAYRDENLTKEEQEKQQTLQDDIDMLNKPEDIPQNKTILGAYKDYWIDLADYYPIKAAKKIKAPVMVLQGERDYQVTMKQYNKWKDNFGKTDNWTFHTYDSLNHFMIAGAGEPNSEEYKIRAHVDNRVTQDIIHFIKYNKDKSIE